MKSGIFRLSLMFLLAAAVIFVFSSLLYAEATRKIVIFQKNVPDSVKYKILTDAGSSIIKPLPLVNGVVINLPEQAHERALEAILAHAPISVLRVDDDLVVNAIAPPAGKPDKPGKPPKDPEPDPDEVLPWGIDRIDADRVWDINSDLIVDSGANIGSGIKVAILDSGIDIDHPDLSDNLAGGINIINFRKSYNDDNGHGTHCAGIVAAVDNEIGVIGVAPGASLYGIKVLDKRGSGFLSDVIDGLDWCISNGMAVINISLGSTGSNQTFHDAIIAVNDAGIVQVVAAGNEYGGPVNFPAAYSETIAVSAVDSSDNLASFSSVGPQVDVAGPGVDIFSTYKGNGYSTKDGTSMACPHVTGTVALILKNNSNLSPSAVKTALKNSAEDVGLLSEEQGAGLVDAAATELATR